MADGRWQMEDGRWEIGRGSQLSRVQDKGAAKSAKRALTAPLSDCQSLIVLAVDPRRSLRGPTSICRPFSHKRGWILHGPVPAFHPCPG
jgi:hypothetical protein